MANRSAQDTGDRDFKSSGTKSEDIERQDRKNGKNKGENNALDEFQDKGYDTGFVFHEE